MEWVIEPRSKDAWVPEQNTQIGQWILTPDSSILLTQTLGDDGYAIIGFLPPLWGDLD